MLKSGHITLLVIPESGGNTFEVKIPRLLIAGAALLVGGICILLLMGFRSYLQVRDLHHQVARLQRENTLFAEEVKQIAQLEQVLFRLRTSNEQLRVILGEAMQRGIQATRIAGMPQPETHLTAVDRLRWGYIDATPTLWPTAGLVVRSFSERFPAVAIAVPLGSVIRASAAGQAIQAGYDPELGHLLVIDHGSGLISQYGYNSRLLVEKGEYVQKGQPIALSGRSGGVEFPALYYAIRENGQYRNPVDFRLWL